VKASDLDIPAPRLREPAWRRARRGRPRVLLLAGLVAVAAFAAAVALVATDDRAEREIPRIVADITPFRVRPADPGGLQVPHQDQLIFQHMAGAGTAPAGRRVEVLLPPPEAPLPVPRPAPPAPAAAPVEAPVEAPPPAETAGLPLPPLPAAPAAPSPPSREEGLVQVQLAAVGTAAAVQPEWNRLRARLPDLLGGQTLVVSRGERDGQPFWRVRTGGFSDLAAARRFCEQVRARGFTCFVVGGS
jgi:hypothetical protein